MTAITPFEFPATGQQVRTLLIDGEPWFVAADVCAALDIANVGGQRQLVVIDGGAA